MIEVGHDVDLTQEPLGPKLRGDIFAHDLDSDFAIVLQIVRYIHGSHPTATK
jgi:hypothetical protein